MPPKLLLYKPAIDAYLTAFLAKKRVDLGEVNSLAPDVITRIAQMTSNGKTIRGALVLFSLEMFGGQISETALAPAAGMELLQTALLIHDDIMDQDELRRGRASMYMQIGTNPAIAAGDLAFSLAIELFTQKSSAFSSQMTSLVSQELQNVCIAQIQDVQNKRLSPTETINLYRFKTSRYTFSLPLRLGAMTAGAPVSTQKQLDRLGEHLGILFQISDDLLNTSGNSTVTGKSTGSDARHGKKTLVEVVQNLEAVRSKEIASAQEIIGRLAAKPKYKKTLDDILSFVCKRDK